MKQKNRDQQFLFNTKKGIVKVVCFKQILPTQDKKKSVTQEAGKLAILKIVNVQRLFKIRIYIYS